MTKRIHHQSIQIPKQQVSFDVLYCCVVFVVLQNIGHYLFKNYMFSITQNNIYSFHYLIISYSFALSYDNFNLDSSSRVLRACEEARMVLCCLLMYVVGC